MKCQISYNPSRKHAVLKLEAENESEEMALQLFAREACESRFEIHCVVEDEPA